MSNLMCVSFSNQLQGDADAVHGFVAPVGMTFVGAVFWPAAIAGTPTTATFDVNVGTTAAAIAAAAVTEAGTAATWKSKHLGGTNAAVAVAADTEITVDLNLAGGSTPTVTYDVQLFFLPGTV